jgi:hypothetical protein
VPHLLRACTPIIFLTQEFLEAYGMGIEAQCSSENAFITEPELITEVLQCLLERWDPHDEQPVSFERSVGFLVGQLHALFVPALKYINDDGHVEYQSAQPREEGRQPATDLLPVLTLTQ